MTDMGTKFNIDLYCVCWNEIKIAKFVVDYWKRFVRHAYVYDNGSDDGTTEFLSQFDWITITPFTSEGFDDLTNAHIKNTAWNASDADYVVVCDFDECLYSKDLDSFIERMRSEGYNICEPQYIDVFSNTFPTYDPEKLCHDICKRGKEGGSKVLLFDPKDVVSMNYTVGCHTCMPYPYQCIMRHPNDIWTMHLKNLSPYYEQERRKILNDRLSNQNRIHRWGWQYSMNDMDTMLKIYNDPKIMNLNSGFGI